MSVQDLGGSSLFQTTFFSYSNLIPSPSGGGKLGWCGGVEDIRNKGQEPPSPQPSPARWERERILMGKAHATVIPQTNTTTSAKGFPNFGCFRRRSVGFARESYRIEAIMDLKYQNTKRSSEKLEIGFSDDLFQLRQPDPFPRPAGEG